MTLNPAEWVWEEARDTYIAYYPEEKETPIENLLRKDPVLFAKFFDRRIRVYYETFLKGEKGLLGHCTHFWWRVEWQQRGTPHVHGFLWIKDAPRLGTHSEEEVAAWIDSKITCRLPDPVKEPQLYALITAFQQHECRSESRN